MGLFLPIVRPQEAVEIAERGRHSFILQQQTTHQVISAS